MPSIEDSPQAFLEWQVQKAFQFLQLQVCSDYCCFDLTFLALQLNEGAEGLLWTHNLAIQPRQHQLAYVELSLGFPPASRCADSRSGLCNQDVVIVQTL